MMGNEIDRLLLENLLERFIPDETGRTFHIQGAITRRELDALRALIELGSPSSPAQLPKNAGTPPVADKHSAKPVTIPAIRSDLPPVKLDLRALTAKPARDVLACIDFGTAFSKAAIWRTSDNRPVPLELERASSGRAGFAIPSTLYIADGSIHFGARALEESRRENNPGRERFESPKQCLSIGDPNDIDRERVSTAVDPTGTFTQGDLLRLYLGFLTSCMTERLRAEGQPTHVARRFAVPVWRKDQLASATAFLRRSLVEGQIVADSIDPGLWSSGLTIAYAKRILSSLRDIDHTAPAGIVDDYILEPMAAAAGIGDHLTNQMARIVVADIGAGTIDLGAYHFVLPADGFARAHVFDGSESAIKQAGNRLDELLISMVIRKSGTPVGSDAAIRIGKILMRDIRATKEALFTQGSAFVAVDDYLDVNITVDEFCREPHVQAFAHAFKAQVVKTIDRAGPHFTEHGISKYAILTGGGASLPMLRSMFDVPFKTEAGSVLLRLVDPTPKWVADFGGDVPAIFPQLAVSTGGASPTLVEQRSAVRDVTRAPVRVWGPKWT